MRVRRAGLPFAPAPVLRIHEGGEILSEEKDQGHTAKLPLVLEAVRLLSELLRWVFI